MGESGRRDDIDPATATTGVDFGRHLRALRQAAGLSTRDVDTLTVRAEVRLTRAKISKVERGELPDLAWLRQFLNVCGLATGSRGYRRWEPALARLRRGLVAAGPAATTPAADLTADPILGVLAQCLVRVQDGDRLRGTGFFVSPGEALTWWGEPPRPGPLDVTWEEGSSTAVYRTLGGGVLLLRLANPPAVHACVRLDRDWPLAGEHPDVLRVLGWSVDENQMPFTAPVGATTSVSTTGHDASDVLRLFDADVLWGLGGAPLLNRRTQGVCGLLAETAGVGAHGVSVAALAAEEPGLLERNRRVLRHDRTWEAAERAETELIDLRARRLPELPLMRPLLDLNWSADGSRADLLHPRYGVVPYLGRESLLAGLMMWREHPDPLRLLVLAGAGGFGKTRTAIEICLAAQRAGWTVGMLGMADDHQAAERIARLRDWPGRLLVAVDYAETKPHIVAELLMVLQQRRSRPPARVILIVRQTGTRTALRELFASGDYGADLAGVFEGADVVRLDADIVEVDRTALFTAATTCFAYRMGGAEPVVTPTLAAEHFCRPLYVLAAALLAVEDRDLSVDDLAGEELLLAILDRHEAEYWDRWNRRLSAGLTRDDQRRAVALAALLGAETEPEALALVRMLPDFADATTERVRAIARWLAHLYGTGRLRARPALTPLEPDLLAEALIARELVDNDSP